MLGSQAEQRVNRLPPGAEAQCRRQPQMRAERRAELMQRFAVGGFLGCEIESPGCRAQRPQQEGLPLAAATGDNAKRCPGPSFS